GLVAPWMLSCFALMSAAAVVGFVRNLNWSRKVRLLKSALEGAVAPKNLRLLARSPNRVDLRAREQVLTVMFIDVVGYSMLAEHQAPRIAFDHLKDLIGKL